jgi:DNA-binding NarL/FixJ family response regulator
MSTDSTIHVAIADDNKIFREGIKMSLKDKDRLSILWEAEDGNELIQKMEVNRPDVLLMEISMPDVDGINIISLLRKKYEQLKIIIISVVDEQEVINKIMEMGANAYLSKNALPEEIYLAITTCVSSDFYFNEMVNKAVLTKLQSKRSARQFYPHTVIFSEKEIKILRLLADDKTTNEISKLVFLSPRTIETIRQNMKSKVGVKTIAGLIMYGMRNRLID